MEKGSIALEGWKGTWANESIDIAPEHLYENGVSTYPPPGESLDYVSE